MVEIVIGHRGWVWVGCVINDTPYQLKISGRCIRRWGTTKGLEELATGPTADTVLDTQATIKLHPLAIIARIECDENAWKAHLKEPQ